MTTELRRYIRQINVAGVSTFKIEIRLNGFTHTFPDDADIILVGHAGKGRF